MSRCLLKHWHRMTVKERQRTGIVEIGNPDGPNQTSRTADTDSARRRIRTNPHQEAPETIEREAGETRSEEIGTVTEIEKDGTMTVGMTAEMTGDRTDGTTVQKTTTLDHRTTGTALVDSGAGSAALEVEECTATTSCPEGEVVEEAEAGVHTEVTDKMTYLVSGLYDHRHRVGSSASETQEVAEATCFLSALDIGNQFQSRASP